MYLLNFVLFIIYFLFIYEENTLFYIKCITVIKWLCCNGEEWGISISSKCDIYIV